MAHRGRFVALALLASCAGAQRPWSGEAYCELPPAEAAVPGHEKWLRLLLRGYDVGTHRVTTPALDCTSAQVRWEAPAAACFDNALATTLLPERPLGERDVVVSTVGEGFGLVWVITNRYASGDALGPVAVVEQRGERLVVRAIGALRAYPDRATLRLERIGATTVLVAEGQLCGGADPASCVRSVRVMPLRRDRFSQEPLFSDAGACVSPAWFDLARQDAERLESGWTRRHQLAASLVFAPEGLHVQESLVVNDADPRQPQAQPRLHRRAQSERTVKEASGRLVVDGRSLWQQVVAAGDARR
jgi:hypothetical protein